MKLREEREFYRDLLLVATFQLVLAVMLIAVTAWEATCPNR
jgi:hypothetical protein